MINLRPMKVIACTDLGRAQTGLQVAPNIHPNVPN